MKAKLNCNGFLLMYYILIKVNYAMHTSIRAMFELMCEWNIHVITGTPENVPLCVLPHSTAATLNFNFASFSLIRVVYFFSQDSHSMQT